MPVGSLLFVGRQTEQHLTQLGIRTIGELACTSPELLRRRFGKLGDQLCATPTAWTTARCWKPGRGRNQSVGHSITFSRDLCSLTISHLGGRAQRQGASPGCAAAASRHQLSR